MRWMYLLIGTAGLVLFVPTVLRAIDRQERDRTTGFIAFTALVAGITGLLLAEFDVGGFVTFVAAGALGLAAGAAHPELLNLVSEPIQDDIVEDAAHTPPPPRAKVNQQPAPPTDPLNSRDAETDA